MLTKETYKNTKQYHFMIFHTVVSGMPMTKSIKIHDIGIAGTFFLCNIVVCIWFCLTAFFVKTMLTLSPGGVITLYNM